MARKTKDEAERTRRRILASALALFAKKGYEKTTLTDVAARIKMTKGAVYWHFASKEKLLVALVDEMIGKFRRQLSVSGGGSIDALTFPGVADAMVRNAGAIIGDAKGKAFFLLVHEQVRWSDDSMAKVREDLLADRRFGPWEAFRRAVENDVRDGRARPGVDAVKVASVCVAIWDGLVHSRIAEVLECDLETTLREAYAAVWRSLKKD